MALSPNIESLFAKHTELAGSLSTADELNLKYYKGLQTLTHIGLAVPPNLRQFEAVLNWNRVAVDSIAQRQKVKSFILPGEAEANVVLQENWAANNLDSESALLHKDVLIYGRGFVCVGANEEDPKHPLVTVESPRELTALVDSRNRRISSALRLYGGTADDPEPVYATLYLPNSTAWYERVSGAWAESDRDDHNLGRVPIVMFLNRRLTGEWAGETEMADVIPHVEIVGRTLLNMQVAGETIAIPRRFVAGLSQGDFVGQDGKPLPVWEAYQGAIWATGNSDAKFGQFDGADLKNFHDTIKMQAENVSSVTGLPLRYLGQNSVNPAAEGAIRADESRLVLNVEDKNSTIGDGWAWVQGIVERFRTGEWPLANQIKTEWFDPGTPTFAQKADALTKLHGGGPILSREGTWDELGFSEPRKAKERAYWDAENADPYLASLADKDVAADGIAIPATIGD